MRQFVFFSWPLDHQVLRKIFFQLFGIRLSKGSPIQHKYFRALFSNCFNSNIFYIEQLNIYLSCKFFVTRAVETRTSTHPTIQKSKYFHRLVVNVFIWFSFNSKSKDWLIWYWSSLDLGYFILHLTLSFWLSDIHWCCFISITDFLSS